MDDLGASVNVFEEVSAFEVILLADAGVRVPFVEELRADLLPLLPAPLLLLCGDSKRGDAKSFLDLLLDVAFIL
jgi:hypothetical protein